MGVGGWWAARKPPASTGKYGAGEGTASPVREGNRQLSACAGVDSPSRSWAETLFTVPFPLGWQGPASQRDAPSPRDQPAPLLPVPSPGRVTNKKPTDQGQAAPAHKTQEGPGDSGTILSPAPRSLVMGSSAERGAGTGRGNSRDLRWGWPGSARVSCSRRSPLEAKEKPGLTSTTTVSHQPEEQLAQERRPAPYSPVHGGWTLGGQAALVGCKDNGAWRGADVGWRRSEKGWSEDGGLEEGGGSSWSQGEGARHGADGGGSERAWQEAGGQGFGEMLLQSQLGLQGGRRRHREAPGCRRAPSPSSLGQTGSPASGPAHVRFQLSSQHVSTEKAAPGPDPTRTPSHSPGSWAQPRRVRARRDAPVAMTSAGRSSAPSR